jgi:Protein of unknown function (DUF3108)
MHRRLLALLAAAWTAAAAPAQAQPQIYRLSYQAAVLNVVELGSASFEVAATPTRFSVRAGLRTSGMARLFDQTEITATSTGAIAGGALNWTRYDISHAYAGKFRRTRMTRAGGQVSAAIEPRYGNMGAPPATAAQQAASYDPLTALFALGRQVGEARACAGQVLVFDGRQHYRLALAPRARGNFNAGGYNGPALTCVFRYQPIAGYSARRGTIPEAEIWFALPAEGGFAPPLRVVAPTPLGTARLELLSYEAR